MAKQAKTGKTALIITWADGGKSCWPGWVTRDCPDWWPETICHIGNRGSSVVRRQKRTVVVCAHAVEALCMHVSWTQKAVRMCECWYAHATLDRVASEPTFTLSASKSKTLMHRWCLWWTCDCRQWSSDLKFSDVTSVMNMFMKSNLVLIVINTKNYWK